MQNNPLVQYAMEAAQKAGISPNIFVKQINQESGFNPEAGSSAGAQGIAQIMPQYHPGVDPYDPYASLDYAANLMASHLRNYNGDYRLALAAYNAGPGAVQQYGGVPPFDETQNYVATILGGGGGGGDMASYASGGNKNLMRPQGGDGGYAIPEPYPPDPSGGFDFGIIPKWLGEQWAKASVQTPNPTAIAKQGLLGGLFGGGSSAAAASPAGGTSSSVVPTPPIDPGDPRSHPSHPLHWEYLYGLIVDGGDIPPFSNAQEYEEWKRQKAAAAARAGGGMQQNEDAWRNAQLQLQYAELKEQAADRLTRLRQGPENWLAYWDTTRGGDGAIGAAQQHPNDALPPWTQAPPPFVSAPPYTYGDVVPPGVAPVAPVTPVASATGATGATGPTGPVQLAASELTRRKNRERTGRPT